MKNFPRLHRLLPPLSLCILLASCGGGGGSPGACVGTPAVCTPDKTSSATNSSTGTPTQLADTIISTTDATASLCVAPRAAGQVNPFSGAPYVDKQGTLADEKSWIRAMMNETYLWYASVPVVDAASFVVGNTVTLLAPQNNAPYHLAITDNLDAVSSYFASLRSQQLSPSGAPMDRFHFVEPTADWDSLEQSGSALDFGFHADLVAASPPRTVLASFIDAGSPAAQNGIRRGSKFLSANGVDVAGGASASDVATLNEALFSPLPGKAYSFVLLDPGSSTPRTISMTPVTLVSNPVQNVGVLPAPNNQVGYLQFNEHVALAEEQLVAAVKQLKAANSGAGISDLVLDLRYNGGGLLAIASELAYMIAGPAHTDGKVFESLTYNDKNPFHQTLPDDHPFLATSQGYGAAAAGDPLPDLGLARVTILTGSGTCSASESIINSLRGVGVEVVLIGATTCGKPYGFIPQENCGVTYFTVQFRGVNQAGFGDYADGFIPGGKGTTANNVVGCQVADDFSHALGDPQEARLAAALQYRKSGSCGGALSATTRPAAQLAGAPGALSPAAVHVNRLLGGAPLKLGRP